jgi:raffinose/stachyose/melibiose transport system permease protein
MITQSTQTRQTRRWFGEKINVWLGVRYLIGIVVGILMFIPLLTTVLGGLKTSGEIISNPLGLPANANWENYTKIVTSIGFWRPLFNSVFVLFWVTLGVVAVSSLAAFVFGCMKFRGREIVFNFFMLGLLFPISVAVLPLFVTLRTLNLLDSLTGVILVEIAFGLPGNILILRGFFKAVPPELEEAAVLDGCGLIGYFWRIMLPLTRPALAAVAILTMVASWNTYFLPLLVLNNEESWTLPLGIQQFQGQFGQDYSLVMAYVTLALIPTIIFYLVAERQIVSGLTAGAVKG